MYLELEASPEMSVYPALGFAYASVKTTYEDSYGQSEEEIITDIMFLGSFTMLFKNGVYISPSLTSFDGSSSWNISAGVAMALR